MDGSVYCGVARLIALKARGGAKRPGKERKMPAVTALFNYSLYSSLCVVDPSLAVTFYSLTHKPKQTLSLGH